MANISLDEGVQILNERAASAAIDTEPVFTRSKQQDMFVW